MSDGVNHVRPLLPTTVLDSQSPQFRRVATPFDPHQSKSGRSSKCFVYLLILIVFLSVFLLVSSLVVARVDTPGLVLRSASLKAFMFSYPGAEPAHFNTTVVGAIEMNNDNYLGFGYEGGDVRVWYGDKVVGEGRVARGRVGAKGSERVRFEVRVDTRKALGRKYNWITQRLGNEVSGGRIGMTIAGVLNGDFNLLWIIKMSRVLSFNCAFSIDFRTKKLVGLQCS